MTYYYNLCDSTRLFVWIYEMSCPTFLPLGKRKGIVFIITWIVNQKFHCQGVAPFPTMDKSFCPGSGKIIMNFFSMMYAFACSACFETFLLTSLLCITVLLFNYFLFTKLIFINGTQERLILERNREYNQLLKLWKRKSGWNKQTINYYQVYSV